MQKRVFTFLLEVEETEMFEKTLNIYRIGLDEWDKSKVFVIGYIDVVNYTVICDDLTAKSLTQTINQYRINSK
jgi:hypothetical protein